MKLLGFISLSLLSIGLAFGQVQESSVSSPTSPSKKGQMYVYWGWNVTKYTDSDITFKGDDYDFTLKDVQASHRPTPFNFHDYFNPGQLTIPQFNFRFGYFFHNNYNVSVGFDHMKYVMKPFQTVKMDGYIENSGSDYDGVYDNVDQAMNKDFLRFEHTDGLNYANVEVRRVDELFKYKNVVLNATYGLGAGLLIPRTNTTLLGKERYDEVHVSGWGSAAVVGLNLTFYERYFIQSEFKGGYINMQNVRTTKSESDVAKQDFFFSQLNVVFGVRINTKRKERMKALKEGK
ncbi:MAG: hypothetical protein ACPG6V_01440 [Flavobacteriales bacterium]